MTATTVTADDFTMQWDDEHSFPFVENEDGDITGYGHQDKAEFAAAINRYDEVANGRPYPEDEQWDADYVSHRWAVLMPDGERFQLVIDGTSPGAFPITTMWGHR